MKPEAPIEYRGEFKPISTNVPGLQICEHLPRTAKICDKLTVLRSMKSRENNHERAINYLLTGYLPLPTNTHESINIFGLEIPAFALYAATANIAIPLVLTLIVWVSYHVEGIRAKSFIKYLASWLPSGLEDMNPFGKAAIFLIEVVSHFVRLISLSVRLFANILAGHLLLLFMGGGLAVLLGIAALGVLTYPMAFAFYVFEVGIVATLQAFIFSILTAIYIGGATAESH